MQAKNTQKKSNHNGDVNKIIFHEIHENETNMQVMLPNNAKPYL